MFLKLELELKRKNITKKQLADFLGISYDTIIKKINGESDFWREECQKIVDNFFPEYTIDDLFKKEII